MLKLLCLDYIEMQSRIYTFSGRVNLQICKCIFGYFLLWRIRYSIGYVAISSEVECSRYMVDPRSLHKEMVDPREYASRIEFKSWTSVFRMFATAEKKQVPHNLVITVTPTFELLYIVQQKTILISFFI